MALDREAIIKQFSRPRQLKLIDVPELGGEVYIRMLTAGEREQWESMIESKAGELRARLAQLTLCDQDGKLLFIESDVKHLNSMPWFAIKRIVEAVNEFNGMTPDAIEAAEKNSTPPPSSSPSTGLPGDTASPNVNLLNSSLPKS